jgi:hypothetical protein
VGCTTSRAQGGLRCCKDDDVTSLGRGRWQRVKGARLWLGATARRLQGELNDGTGSGEFDDSAVSKKIFGGKFWQPDGVSESLWRLGLAKGTQWFIYRATTSAMGTGDVSSPVSIEDHSSDGRLPSLAHCYYDPYIFSPIIK